MMCTRAALRRLLIATPLGLAGCASVMGPGVTPQVRTIASVGDKPLPIISGPPGDTVVAAREAPEVKPRPDGRVSGRVFDETGRPVPNAQVRLAVGGAERGRASQTVSDESGAFTLRGLRRGESYTLVVESEEGQEVRSGRAEVEAPEHDVRIALAPDESPRRADAQPEDSPRRVGRVSERRAKAPDEDDDTSSLDPAPRVNHEDLPPVEEVGTASGIDDLEAPPEDEPPAPRPKGRPKTAPAPSGWHRPGATGDREASQAAGTEPDLQETEDLTSQASEEAAPQSSKAPAFSPTPEEASPEPAEQTPAHATHADAARGPAAEAPRPEEPAVAAEPKAAEAKPVDPPPPAEPKLAEVTTPVAEPKPAEAPPVAEPKPDEAKPVAEAPASAATEAPASAATEAPAPTPDPAPAEPAPIAAEPKAETSKAAEATGQTDLLPDLVEPAAGAGVPQAGAVPEVKEAATAPPVPNPPAEAAPTPETPASPPAASPVPATEAKADPVPPNPIPTPAEPAAPPQAEAKPAEAPAPEAKEADAGVPRKRTTWGELKPPTPAASKAVAAEPRRSLLGLRNRGPAKLGVEAAAGAAVVAAECKMDSRRNQLLDFRLPDAQGRPVRFKDLDADLVLLDFWGTWCPPCIQSVPHLIALQEKLGAGRLKVVGIAYEKSGSAAERAALVTASASKLGINYQVLLGDSDSCPLQAALHVQAYPTMVLLDREGHILWRDQGSSAGTLARLDRVIDAQAAAVVARR